MRPLIETRKTIQCKGTEFLHETLVAYYPEVIETDPIPKYRPIARCRTRRPATRCECAMFDLAWVGPEFRV